MKVSYVVAIGMVVLFALLFVLDYIRTATPEEKKTDTLQMPNSSFPDSLTPIHQGDIIKQQSTRDIFKALADDE